MNMTKKSSSRKQIIVSISNENKSIFMESLDNYITNINRALKNVKSKVMADFVWVDQAGIVIVTNKVASQLDLQTIEKYIKNASDIDIDKVEVPRLPQSK